MLEITIHLINTLLENLDPLIRVPCDFEKKAVVETI